MRLLIGTREQPQIHRIGIVSPPFRDLTTMSLHSNHGLVNYKQRTKLRLKFVRDLTASAILSAAQQLAFDLE